MNRHSRRMRRWLQLAATAAILTTFQAHADDSRPAYEILGPTGAGHAAVRVLDTERMPVMGRNGANPLGWGSKILYQGPKGGALRLLYVPPGAEGAKVHYHTFHEWAYNIEGDFTNNESTTPENYSILQRFREGAFLSRPPYSLHGGERGRMKWMASQIGAIILIMEESDIGGGSYTVERPQPGEGGMQYSPNLQSIHHWSTPRIIDTLDHMPWQPVEGSPGLNAKYLIDDPDHGFRATMWFLEAGAATPARFARPYAYKEALQLNFVIAGDLKVNLMGAPGQQPRTVQLGRHFFVEREPSAVFALPAKATDGGVVWLEVTYAKGNKWTSEYTPIEEPAYLQ